MLSNLPCRPALLIATMLIASTLANPVRAETPWLTGPFEGTAAEVLAAADALPKGGIKPMAALDVLLDSESIEFTGRGQWRRVWRRVFRVLNTQGVSAEKVTRAAWTPWCENSPVIQVRVITADGKEHRLDPKTLSEAPLPSQQADVFTTRKLIQAPLPAIEVGAIVEEVTIIATHRPFFEAGVALEMGVIISQPSRVVRRSIQAPVALKMKHRVLGQLAPLQAGVEGETQRLAVELKDVQPLEQFEPLRPRDAPLFPIIVVSTGKSWEAISSSYYELIKDKIDPTYVAAEVELIAGDEAARAKLSREEIVNRLLRHVRRRIRYTGLAFGDQSIVPYHPEQTLRRRFGDCKDQSVLLVSMLKAAGVPADVALLRSADDRVTPAELPGMNHFDHAIVHVPGDPPIWLDATGEFSPAGKLPVADQGRPALLVRAEKGTLTNTPAQVSANSTIQSTHVIESTPSGTATMDVKLTRTGFYARQYRVLRNRIDGQQHQAMLLQQHQVSSPNAKMLSYSESDLDPLGGPFENAFRVAGVVELTSNTQVAQYYHDWSKAVELLPPQLKFASPGPDGAPATRKGPLQLALLFQQQAERTIRAPKGFKLEQLPKDEVIEIGPLKLSCRFEAQADNIVVYKSDLDVGNGLFSADEVNQLRDALKQRFSRPNGWTTTLTFHHPAFKLLAQKKYKEALQLLKTQLAESPTDASAHVQYSSALMRTGFAVAAKRHARRAVELTPEEAGHWAHLAWALSHDDYSRIHRPTCDWSGAEAAYRKAIELNPTSQEFRLALGQLLLQRDRGRRFVDQKSVESAIEVWKAALQQFPNSPQLTYQLVETYLLTGRFREAFEFTQPRVGSDIRSLTPFLTALAALQGGAAAAQRINQIQPNPDGRIQLSQAVVGNLVSSRAYSQAAEVLTATPAYPNGSEIRTYISKMKQQDGAFDTKANAANAVREVYRQLILGEARASIHDALFVGVRKADQNEMITRTMRQYWLFANTPHAATDGILRAEILGEQDSTGAVFRLMHTNFLEWYVVKLDGQHRVIASNADYAALGEVALILLDKGQGGAAQQLLDWALDEWRPQVNVFDTFSACAFARYWIMTRRDAAATENKESLQVAAAMLAGVDGMAGDKALSILKRRLKTETENIHTTQLLRTIGDIQLSRNDFPGAEQSYARLIDKHISREEVAYGYAMALLKQGKDEQLQQQLDRLTKGKPTPGVQRAKAEIAAENGKYLEASELLSKSILSRHRFRARFYTFFHEGVGDQWVSEPSSLISPAGELAPRGRHEDIATFSHEAYQTAQAGDAPKTLELLGLSLQAAGQRGIDERLFTVFGRLAEAFDLPEVARESYERAAQHAKPGTIDFAQLAKVRLARMAATN